MFTVEEKKLLLYYVNSDIRRLRAAIGYQDHKEYGDKNKIKKWKKDLEFYEGLKVKLS